MRKRKNLLFLAILLFTTAVFGAQPVMAFSDFYDEPLETLTKSGWTVELVSVTEVEDGTFDWYYRIFNANGTASSLNFAAMLVPDCFIEPKVLVDVDSPLATGFTYYFPVGAGEPTLDFGAYNEQARVAKGNADKQTNWHLITNTKTKTSSTILLKTRKIGVVTFEMVVPGCLPEADEITQATEEFTYVNNDGLAYTVTVIKDQFANLLQILRTYTDPVTGQTVTEDITASGKPVGQIIARFKNELGQIIKMENFNYVPSGTVSKTGENSTCGYWYNNVFWNFCF
jgi:hypothetical protein